MTDELKAHFKPAYDFTMIYKFHKIYIQIYIMSSNSIEKNI